MILLPTLAIVLLSLLERMVRLDSVGAVVSIVKELTERLSLTTPLLVVTLILQLLWVPSGSALKVTVLLSAKAVSLSLLQTPL